MRPHTFQTLQPHPKIHLHPYRQHQRHFHHGNTWSQAEKLPTIRNCYTKIPNAHPPSPPLSTQFSHPYKITHQNKIKSPPYTPGIWNETTSPWKHYENWKTRHFPDLTVLIIRPNYFSHGQLAHIPRTLLYTTKHQSTKQSQSDKPFSATQKGRISHNIRL